MERDFLMSEEVKRMVIEELRAEINDLKAGVDYYEEVLRLRAQTWADAKSIDELKAKNERLREAVIQYRDDLFYPPSPESWKRRVEMVERLLK